MSQWWRNEGATKEYINGRWAYERPYQEMKAAKEGAELGARWGSGIEACIRAAGIQLETLPAGTPYMGCYTPATRTIGISAALDGHARFTTMVHEYAHSRGFGHERDADCDVFMAAWLAAMPSVGNDARRRAAVQQRLLQRAIAAARR